MKRSYRQYTPYLLVSGNMVCVGCPSQTALFVGGRFNGSEDMRRNINEEIQAIGCTDELQGKVGQCFYSDSKVGPQVVSAKIILTALRYFPRKPCLTGSISRNALVVQRTQPKSEY